MIFDDDNASTLLRVIFVSLTSWYGIIVTADLMITRYVPLYIAKVSIHATAV